MHAITRKSGFRESLRQCLLGKLAGGGFPRRVRRSCQAKRVNDCTSTTVARAALRQSPETFETPPTRRCWPIGTSVTPSPAAATRICISRFQPKVLSAIPKRSSASRRIARNGDSGLDHAAGCHVLSSMATGVPLRHSFQRSRARAARTANVNALIRVSNVGRTSSGTTS